MAEKVKVGGKEFILEDKDAALILAIRDLTLAIRSMKP